MPNFGAESLGGTPPSGYLQESSKDITKEIATIRDYSGPVVVVGVKPRSLTTIVCKTKGEASFAPVAGLGDFSSAVTSAKVSQTNDDFSTAEATFSIYA
jgi:hydroxyethylthiazole kinase-like sugar kinase family protein